MRGSAAIAWPGNATAFASGIAGYALASNASLESATALLLVLGTVSGASMAAAALAAHRVIPQH